MMAAFQLGLQRLVISFYRAAQAGADNIDQFSLQHIRLEFIREAVLEQIDRGQAQPLDGVFDMVAADQDGQGHHSHRPGSAG